MGHVLGGKKKNKIFLKKIISFCHPLSPSQFMGRRLIQETVLAQTVSTSQPQEWKRASRAHRALPRLDVGVAGPAGRHHAGSCHGARTGSDRAGGHRLRHGGACASSQGQGDHTWEKDEMFLRLRSAHADPVRQPAASSPNCTSRVERRRLRWGS